MTLLKANPVECLRCWEVSLRRRKNRLPISRSDGKEVLLKGKAQYS